MWVLDGAITAERLKDSRSKQEFIGYAIKEASILFFMYYAGGKIQDFLEKQAEKKDSEASCWEKFANISRTLGIVTMCTFWIPIFGLFGTLTGIPGIVFGVLGKKANTEEAINNAKKGFITSLVGTILSVVLFISIYIAIIVIAIAASTY